jgi:hypothetical protein
MEQSRRIGRGRFSFLALLVVLELFLAGLLLAGAALGESEVTPAWVQRYNGPGNSYDAARALAVDGQGNAYVTGKSKSAASDTDYTTIKYSPDGQELWVASFTGPGQFADEAFALAVDGRGNVYVTGSSISVDTGYDFATVKYTQSGAYVPLGLLLID